jgi:excinuclease ABC subunit A
LFAGTDAARRLGLGPGAFSFNSAQGQCQRCRGAGFEKIEMQFLSDVFIRCPECDGKRYRPHVLAVELRPPDHESQARKSDRPRKRSQHRSAVKPWNLSRLLDATIDDALVFLRRFPQPAAARAVTSLQFLQKVGLGYLRLGQPINTLSGGESQRLKLVGALAESARIRRGEIRPALYLLDEPTTGLHFDDVRVLLDAFQELVDAGHSVVVIEHNLDVIRSADWVIDLGPEAGDEGGRLVAEGTPESIMNCPASHTGVALRQSSRNSVSDRIAC